MRRAPNPTAIVMLALGLVAISAMPAMAQQPKPSAPPVGSKPQPPKKSGDEREKNDRKDSKKTQSAIPGPVLSPPPPEVPVASVGGVQPPADYVIGPEDSLAIVFWREKELSSDVLVRPDGMISLPLLNDLPAAGLTPEQLRQKVIQEANRFVEDANVTVVVKQINSRKVFITGHVNKPGPYPLISPTTVLQLIATAGGLVEFADDKNILIIRTERGRQMSYRFNYKDVTKRKNLQQNIQLKPGDTIVVP